MRRIAKRRACVVLAAAGGVLIVAAAGAGPALGLFQGVVAQNTTFVIDEVDILEGGVLTFTNDDDFSHNVTAKQDGPDGKPFFRSGTFSGPAVTRDVAGTEYLEAGVYGFHCTIHPGPMQGTLTVQDSPAGPVARPEISVEIKSKKLGKVVKSGKLKVDVEAAEPTFAEGVSLTAKKGRKKISKRLDFNLAAGGSKAAKLKLKKSAVEKLADLDKARVKVTGEVDFGSPAKASKKLK